MSILVIIRPLHYFFLCKLLMKINGFTESCVEKPSLVCVCVCMCMHEWIFVVIIVVCGYKHRQPCTSGHWNILSRLITKPIKWHVHPAKTQISLDIRPVRSESSLCAQRVAKGPSGHWRLWSDWADAKIDLSLCWAHNHFVGFVMRWLKFNFKVLT